MIDVRHYLTSSGRDFVAEWIADLRDLQAKAAIIRRLNRLEGGNFGDHKPLQDGVYELRIDAGPGYRVYYARSGKTVVLLLCGGTKRTQQKDISSACALWRDWQSRPDE
ncbi:MULTISPECIES: type II toxin-antitoxin system RelE/ParE family toxin [unclassified Aureimonas]|uniref:type II toxin-antitoxin system RelE/ParE family toxin n=1 Tax=unclassified Aureimonas TaxID=2615206 RepID=UPI0006F4C068|nr:MULTISPECIES: type II toxin-antitoxin system RelE/ParE family toxin [unclassified Aureimonas]KQT61283.1 addiction module killer protein [Aureimonas sp. Leaf460]KQT68732.1 addiction module killer protein [Aureimonas sp. Leaf427]